MLGISKRIEKIIALNLLFVDGGITILSGNAGVVFPELMMFGFITGVSQRGHLFELSASSTPQFTQ